MCRRSGVSKKVLPTQVHQRFERSENKKLSFAAVHAVAGGAIRDRERKRKRTLCQKPLRHRERAHRTTS
jgi:hypothetical protein